MPRQLTTTELNQLVAAGAKVSRRPTEAQALASTLTETLSGHLTKIEAAHETLAARLAAEAALQSEELRALVAGYRADLMQLSKIMHEALAVFAAQAEAQTAAMADLATNPEVATILGRIAESVAHRPSYSFTVKRDYRDRIESIVATPSPETP